MGLERLDILRWFFLARGYDRIGDRARLLARQRTLLTRLRSDVLPRSPYFARWASAPFEDIPVIDKVGWMAAFDAINTCGVRLADALAVATRAERERDFSPTLGGLTVGLSTGTSGRRGVFLVSAQERRRWAGVMLAKLLPKRPFARRRIAFFLRANSRLYETARGFGPIDFRYFDLVRPWRELRSELSAFGPDVLIAPASVLRLIAEAGAPLSPTLIVSVAETLHADDRAVIEAAFPAPLGEAYQATEGCLAVTCPLGRLHLNEEWMLIEPDWIDRRTRRFAPIVTDLTRAAQPVVRYRLDDVLIMAEAPCPCGKAALTLDAVEGRCDDIVQLLAQDGTAIAAFPDLLVRAVLSAAPDLSDFRIVQRAPGALEIGLLGGGAEACARIRAEIASLAARLGGAAPCIAFVPYVPPTTKRRRVERIGAKP